ncbi:MAG: Rrf2 family transcriptional regulator [Anaerovoracaceae bacterium]
MKFSTKSRYALRFMVDLAIYSQGNYIPLKEISKRQGISSKYLEQIISLFHKNGYLKSVRGPQGGYMLSKSPAEYTLGDILRVTEGNLAPIPCLMPDENECARQGSCSTLSFWSGLNDAIAEYVDSFTLADLTEKQRGLDGMDFSI